MKDKILAVSSVFTAVGASLCCTLPIVFALAGTGIVGASAFFAGLRPYLLGLTFIALGAGFYMAYRTPRSACEPGSVCARPAVNRSSRIVLWVVTPLVIAIAAFPYYSGPVAELLLSQGQAAPAAGVGNPETLGIVLPVEGMDCAACAASVEKKLSGLTGVRAARVSFERGTAEVEYDPNRIGKLQIQNAIRDSGFRTP